MFAESRRRARRPGDIAVNPFVSVLVDLYDDDWTQLWWARADGTATVVGADDEAVDALAARYPAYVERRHKVAAGSTLDSAGKSASMQRPAATTLSPSAGIMLDSGT